MTSSPLYLPKTFAGLRVADWLSFGAAPTFAIMAALTNILGGGAHDMMCWPAAPMSALSGMVPMYVLMSVFHLSPWLKLIAGWRSSARAAVRGTTA